VYRREDDVVSDVSERFAALVARADADVPLDECCVLIAAHAHADLDVAVPMAQLDELATAFRGGDAHALARHLFVERGFAGNTHDYTDPRNSYLDDVLERRLGIPITLSILMIEVGRRCAIPLAGVGMPGHFLVASANEPRTWFDPFNRGMALDEAGCAARFRELFGPDAEWVPAHLAPIGNLAIVRRMLANLERSLLRREPPDAAWVLRLELRLPNLTPPERRRLAGLLGSLGHFSEGAALLDQVATELGGDDADAVRRDAAALRARTN
jgi:regulator of sirC expression with transglutaminase-like and TPR domain